jgi:hypothetical protein
MTKEIYQYLQDEGFQKKWCDDKSGFWYEKIIPTFFGDVEMIVEDSGVWVQFSKLDTSNSGKTELKNLDQIIGVIKSIQMIPKKL